MGNLKELVGLAGVLMVFGAAPQAVSGSLKVKEAFTKADGASLKTFEYGHGKKTLILVHGGPALPGYMRSLGELLADSYFIVEYLQRDSAASQSKGPFTIAKKAADLENVVKKYSKSPLVIVAHSGGTIATGEFAKRNVGAVSKIILISASGLNSKTDELYDKNLSERLEKLIPEWQKKLDAATARYRAAKGAGERFRLYHEMLDLYWPAYFSDGKKPDSLKFLPAKLGASSETEADYSKNMKEGVFEKDLEKIETPVVHLHGELDPLPSKATRETFQSRLKHYEFILVKDAGHFPWLEKKTVGVFLEKLKAAID